MLAEQYLKIAEWNKLYTKWRNHFKKPEEKVAIAISNYLHTDYPDLLWWHTPNEGKRGFMQQALASLLGMRSGIPDIQIPKPILDYSQSDLFTYFYGFFCEIKARSERKRVTKTKGTVIDIHTPVPSENQKEIMRQLTKLGYYCCVVYTLEEFVYEWTKYNK